VEQRCAAVLPRQAAEQILANYRERLRTARENAVREERALRALLVADNSTKAALDAQTLKTNDARNALSRVRLDMLWDLRSVVPAQDRAIAFRCAERLLMRGR
jgi:Spy/CpxP family protein refolding chaperone